MNELSTNEVDFAKGGGLVPVVAQDRVTKKVLMLAYANRKALELTMTTGYAHYYSRSRGKLWKKGEGSGHTQRVWRVRVDCDRDSLIYEVDQTGPACHTGNETCFFTDVSKAKGQALLYSHARGCSSLFGFSR